MKGNQKIKAGALQFVLFIGAIIAVMLMVFLLISYTHDIFDKKTDLTTEIVQATEYGIRYAFEKDLSIGDSIKVSPASNTNISVVVKRNFWGVFELWTSTAKHKTIEFSKIALTGKGRGGEMEALFLRDRQRPLIIAGAAKITGDAFLPEPGIRMGNISGNSYINDLLVYGKQKKSNDILPRLSPDLLVQVARYTNMDFPQFDNLIETGRNVDLKNSFYSSTKFIGGNTIDLEGVSLTGNFVIYANEKIIVRITSRLRDVLLIAPEIVVDDGVQGYFQGIAKKAIKIGKNCRLAYPTALVVQNNDIQSSKDRNGKELGIYVDSGTKIDGILLYLEDSDTQYYDPQIKIAANALLLGEVYCSKNLELIGTVMGNVTTDAFIALQNGSIYQNHLYNGKINASGLNTRYVGLLTQDKGTEKVMKWMY